MVGNTISAVVMRFLSTVTRRDGQCPVCSPMNPLMQISEVSVKVCFVGRPGQSINPSRLTAKNAIRRLWRGCRQFGAQETQTLAHRNPALQQEGTNLIDDAVRCLTSRSRTRCSACKSSWSAVLVATNFIVGRCTASAIASASRKSFFCPFEYGRTYFAGISRAS